MKVFTVKIKVNDDISFRDIERTLNVLDAETEMLEVEEVEDDV